MSKHWDKNSLNLSIDHYPYVIALIGDTHIPDDQISFPQGYLEQLKACNPDIILHTGDVCDLRAMQPLFEIAPMYIVRGNRDIFSWFRLPALLRIEIAGLKLLLCHGQGTLFQYLKIKLYDTGTKIMKVIPVIDRLNRLPSELSEADICVYGHSHCLGLREIEGKLLINPGCSFKSVDHYYKHNPSFGLIRFLDNDNYFVELWKYDIAWHRYCNIFKQIIR